MRSTVALLLLLSQKSSLVEAHCLLLFEPSQSQTSLCVSMDALGAALFLPNSFAGRSDIVLPFVITITAVDTSHAAEIITLVKGYDGSLTKGESLFNLILPENLHDEPISEPTLAMGPFPTFLCLCCNDCVVFVYRGHGTFLIYKYSNENNSLLFLDRLCLKAFVADATIRAASNPSEKIEITALLCGSESTKDGLISVITI